MMRMVSLNSSTTTGYLVSKYDPNDSRVIKIKKTKKGSKPLFLTNKSFRKNWRFIGTFQKIEMDFYYLDKYNPKRTN